MDLPPPYVIETLPPYIVADVEELEEDDAQYLAIRSKAEQIDFPLNFQDKVDIAILMKKFTKQPFYTGLAAPQLNILKQIIVFTIPRGECTDRCRTKVWLNPSYEKANDHIVEDYEFCVSVKGVTGLVKRYNSIHYRANDIKGNVIKGVASGLTARIIQHEIDHLDGKLFLDLVPQEKIISMREFVKNFKSKPNIQE